MANCDGTGILPSVNLNNAEILLKYIVEKTQVKQFVDLGTGLGVLPLVAKRTGLAKVIGVEGSFSLYQQASSQLDLCDRQLILHADIIHEHDKLFNTVFELSTSFEMIEHVPRELQLALWKSLAKYSRKHLCSIHTALPEHNDHPTILSRIEWEGFFNQNNIAFEYLDDFPLKAEWNCSAYWLLDLSQMKGTDE